MSRETIPIPLNLDVSIKVVEQANGVDLEIQYDEKQINERIEAFINKALKEFVEKGEKNGKSKA